MIEYRGLHIFICSFLFYCYSHHRDLHSFPTRRSSDLQMRLSHRFLLEFSLEVGFRGPYMDNWVRYRTALEDRKSTRLNSSHTVISYAVFCLKKKKNK